MGRSSLPSQFITDRASTIKADADSYPLLLTKTNRKRLGAIYTPDSIASFIIKESLKYLRHTPKSCLDPSCGSGIFLLELLKQCPGLSLSHLYGFDIDQQAVENTKNVLSHLHSQVSHQITFDFGNDPKNRELLDSRIIQEDFLLSPLPFDINPNGYELIIGNPPYGISRDGKITNQEKILLSDKYKEWSNGKLDKYQLFMARCYELLAPGGVLGFIVPNSWMGIKSAARLRENLLDSIRQISTLGFSPFGDPSVETVIVILQKPTKSSVAKKEKKAIKLYHLTNNSLVIHSRGELLPDEIRRNHDLVIPKLGVEGAPLLFKKIHNSFSRLDTLFSPFIALQAYSVGKGIPLQSKEMVAAHCYHTTIKESEFHIPYLEGKDISRFDIQWSGSYLFYGKHLAEPNVQERFTKPRIVLREIIGKAPYFCCAAFTTQPFLYNKSVMHILAQTGDGESLLPGLTVYLNSSFVSFYLAYWGRKANRRLFPKLLRDDLAELPIPSEEVLFSFGELYSTKCTNTDLDAEILTRLGITDLEKDVITKSFDWLQ